MKTNYALLGLSTICLGFTAYNDYSRQAVNLVEETQQVASVYKPEDAENKTSNVSSVSTIVAKANTFKGLLSTAQISTLEQTFTNTLAKKWSNLPCGSSCRNGIQFGTLTTAQLAAAKDVIKEAAGTAASEGYDEFMSIVAADSILGTVAGNNYSKGIYFISFLNTPSATGQWMLQFGGHHYAANIAFNNGNIVGVTPVFEGIEPKNFTIQSTAFAPIDQEKNAMAAMFASLTSAELSSAQLLNQSFSDVVLGPNQDGNFPATKAGLQVSTLSAAQQLLVMAAMEPWLSDVEPTAAAALRTQYQSELSNTYIAFSGNPAFTANGNYARIDGPGVWIEFVCQSGVVYASQIHYHSVFRDHTRDYGNYLANTTLTTGTATGIQNADKLIKDISVYPNPTARYITLSFNENLGNATIKIIDVQGKVLSTSYNVEGIKINVDVSAFAKGIYMIKIEDKGKFYSGKFTRE